MRMRMRMRRFRLLLACLYATLANAAWADDVTPIPGSSLKPPGGKYKGQIVSETATELNMTINGKNQTLPVDQIGAVEYTGQPQAFNVAAVREQANHLNDALDQYAKAIAASSDRPLMAREARFARARVLAQVAMIDPKRRSEAIAALESFVKSNPNVRQTVPALELLTRLSILENDFDRADRAVVEMRRIAWASDKAALWNARILSKRGKHAEAIAAIDAVLSKLADGSARKREALLAKAESLAGLSRFDDAEKLARDVIKSADAEDAAAQAVAWNTLGDCLRSANKPKEALLAYLRTDLLYPEDKEQHARSLAEIVRLFRRLKQDDRADEVYARLKQDFPASPWFLNLNQGR